MSDAIDDLATTSGVQTYLQDYPRFVAHTVEKLTGGLGNFTYRIHLHRAFAGRQTLVLKYAPPYAAASGGKFPLDQKRQFVEVQALRLASQLPTTNASSFVTVPAVHLFDEERHVIIMDDVGEDSQTLKQILIEEDLPKHLSEQIGATLGEFIFGVHTCSQNASVDLTLFANNELGKYITTLITYGRLESTLTGRDNIPTLSDPLLEIPEGRMKTILKLVEKRQQAINAASTSDPLTHGDLWPGNVVLSLKRGTDGSVEGVEKLSVLDWEVCKTGLPGLDLGQFCAEVYVLSKFFPTREESAMAMIGSFLDAYKERMVRGGDVELARIVLSHIGAHMVAMTPRVSSWSGREKTREVVEKGVDMLVLGEEGTEQSLRASIRKSMSLTHRPPHLAELPPEIYDGILAHVPLDERKQTTLSLTRAIPCSPVPLHHLFERIRLRSADRVVQLYCRLRGRLEESYWVREFSLETWSVDADVVVNLLALLQRLSTIVLFIGPNFAPEHIEDILEKPREILRYISLRFRPYVQRATYYQFLKGAYFDNVLLAISRWPKAKLPLPTLSIAQDPLDPDIARRHRFAQPLVFFRFDPINVLACSPYLQSLINLRLRIPSRQVAPFIYSSPRSVPGLRILDLSTCDIRLADVEALLARFRQLAHLIVDGCNITRGDTQEGEWVNLGKICALATIKAAKGREKKLKSWLEAHAVRSNTDSEPPPATPETEVVATRRSRPGRRGLATATISLRDVPTRTTTAIVPANIVVPKVRVLPSTPILRSLSTTRSVLHKDHHEAIRAQFEKGWDEGLAQLTAVRGRLYQSWRNGVKIMCIAGDQGMEEGFEGLEVVDGEGAFYGSRNIWPVPVLCLAGAARDSVQHVDGCGHAAASYVWRDDI